MFLNEVRPEIKDWCLPERLNLLLTMTRQNILYVNNCKPVKWWIYACSNLNYI